MQAERQAYREQLAQVRPQDLVFVDESGVHRGMTRLYGRSPRGQRAYGSAPRNYGPNISVLGALSLAGPLTTVHVAGPIDGELFRLFVEKVLVPALWPPRWSSCRTARTTPDDQPASRRHPAGAARSRRTD